MEQKQQRYDALSRRILSLIDGETDWIAVMATVVCELHASFDYFDWTGFYRVVSPRLLKIGPYQGKHGCLSISFERGICGQTARTGTTQRVDDVNAHHDHIACAASTQSEIVVPVFDQQKQLQAVLDVDSNQPCAFDEIDQRNLEDLCDRIYPACT